MRFILILSFLFSFNVLAQNAPSGKTLSYVYIYFDSLASVESSLSKDKRGLVDNLVLNGSGKGFFETKESRVRNLTGIKKDFRSKSISLNFALSGDQFKKYSDQLAKCLEQAQQQFYQNQGMIFKARVYWRNDDLEKIYKSNNKQFPINLSIDPDLGFNCSQEKEA